MDTWQRTVRKEDGYFLFLPSQYVWSISETLSHLQESLNNVHVLKVSVGNRPAVCLWDPIHALAGVNAAWFTEVQSQFWYMRWGVVWGSTVALVLLLLLLLLFGFFLIDKNCSKKLKSPPEKKKKYNYSEWIWYSIFLVSLCFFFSQGNLSSFLLGTVQIRKEGD